MQNSKDIIKNKKYRNWVKCSIGIQQTSKALHVYVYEKFSLYLHGIAGVNNSQDYLTDDECSHFRDELTSHFRQNLDKLYEFKRGQWHYKDKNCPECKNTFYKILSLHKCQKYRDIHWENSNNTCQLTPEWTIAKIFMPKGNVNNKGPKDTDPSAIFTLMRMCKLFMNAIRERHLDEVTYARNALFHPCEKFVEDDEVGKYFDSMISLLHDASSDRDIDDHIKQRISEDIEKIKKLKDSELVMTLFEDTMKDTRIKREGFYYKLEQCLCNNDPMQVEELIKLSEKQGSELEYLNNSFYEIRSRNAY